MKIAVDIDDTLAAYIPDLLKYTNPKYNEQFSMEDADGFDLSVLWGVSQAESQRRVYEFESSDRIHLLKPIPGALNVLNQLKKNNELIVITSRRESVRDITETWVDKHFPGIFSGVYFSRHFSGPLTEPTKGELCEQLGASLLIDDRFGYLKTCAEMGIKGILVDQPWNQGADLSNGVKRVGNWKNPETIWTAISEVLIST